MKLISIATVLLSGVMLLACAPHSLSNKSYPRHTTMTAMTVRLGKVLAVEEVLVEGDYGVVGAWGGATVGHAAGHSVGGGSGHHIAAAVGGVIGAIAGQAIEKSLSSEIGLEITVEMDDGQVLAIVQGTQEHFEAGDRVRILMNHGTARVKRL